MLRSARRARGKWSLPVGPPDSNHAQEMMVRASYPLGLMVRFALLITAFVACAAAPFAWAAATVSGKPNIIVFVADDLGVPFTGCYGNPAVHTPRLDAMAQEGMKLTRVFAASPTCSP